MPDNQKEIELEKELKVYKAKAEANDAELAKAKEAAEKAANEIKAYKAKIEQAEKEAAEMALNDSVKDLVKEHLIPPSAEKYARDLIGEEKKTYTVDDKEVSKADVLKKLLSLVAETRANTKEKTIDGDEIRQSQDDNEKIQKYMADHDCSYGQAYRYVMRGRMNGGQ